jgi:hypothetical protein
MEMSSIGNAGGTPGGTGRFFLGLLMIIVGGYLFLDAVHVNSRFGLWTSVYALGGFNVRSGMILVPFIFGVGMIFYNSRWVLGWILAIGSVAAMSFGVITSLHFRLRPMSAFDIMTILVLGVGGIGIFLSSLRDLTKSAKPSS